MSHHDFLFTPLYNTSLEKSKKAEGNDTESDKSVRFEYRFSFIGTGTCHENEFRTFFTDVTKRLFRNQTHRIVTNTLKCRLQTERK
jgi:hypothetical protein